MSFKFNFSGTGADTDGRHNDESTPKNQKLDDTTLEAAIEIFHTEDIDTDFPFQDITLGDNTDLKYVLSSFIERDVKEEKNENLGLALDQNSDLIPNVYEGGLKVWECCIDLTEYVSSLDIAFRGLKVLELGCGAGLPGLYSLVKGAEVHFQDYNKEVLNRITIPNVQLNMSDCEVSCPRSKYFAGDWSFLQEKLSSEMKSSSEKYDMILTSETIYNRDNYKKLHDLMKAVLKPSGVIYLAAKIHYFGVGGGLRDFETHVNSWDHFSVKTCHKVTEGVQREILEMRFKNTSSTS